MNYMTRSCSRILFTGLLLALVFFTAKPAHAGSLSSDIIALFPQEVGEFTYVDLKSARSETWFPQLQQQLLPENFRQFEKSLAAAGIDPNTQVEELALGLVAQGVSSTASGTGSSSVPTGDNIVGIALGSYNPDSTEAYFKQQKLATSKIRNFTMYAFGSGDLYFLFIDSSTAAFGNRATLEKMIQVRFGDSQGMAQNTKLLSLINEANGSGVVWSVLNPAYTRLAMQQLAPQLQQFPEAAKLTTRLQNMIISIKADGGIDGTFQAICGSTDDANTLAQLLQMGLLYQQYTQKSSNPDMAQLLSQATVTPAGDRVSVHMTLTSDQMATLIQHNTFSLKM